MTPWCARTGHRFGHNVHADPCTEADLRCRSTEFAFGVPWIMSSFHQDWTLSASTAPAAVADQFVEELEPEAVLLVRRDARLLLEGLPPDRITELWQQGVEGGERFYHRDCARDGAPSGCGRCSACGTHGSPAARTPRLSPTPTASEEQPPGLEALPQSTDDRVVLGADMGDGAAGTQSWVSTMSTAEEA